MPLNNLIHKDTTYLGITIKNAPFRITSRHTAADDKVMEVHNQLPKNALITIAIGMYCKEYGIKEFDYKDWEKKRAINDILLHLLKEHRVLSAKGFTANDYKKWKEGIDE